MVLFNYARWVAKEVTGPKNIDKKIFITGPSGSGKSMAGLRLALAVKRWISHYNHGNFDHADDYFQFDKDHIAIIDTEDLIHVMTTKLRKNSIKIIDDCGTSVGFTNRRAMSNENLDIASIYSTNRVRNGVTIYCVQDEKFTDLRMRKLANENIDFTEYIQKGPYRVAKLRKMKMDERAKGGVKKCRFMTYDCGQWVTIETIAIDLPADEPKAKYDEMREKAEDKNTRTINDRYKKLTSNEEIENNKPRCPYCNSTRLYYSKKLNKTTCRGCGRTC
jgi:hypothetical protein